MTEALADAKDYQDQLRVAPGALAQPSRLVKGGTLSLRPPRKSSVGGRKGGDPPHHRGVSRLIQVGDSNVVSGGSNVLGAHAPEVGRYRW